MSPREIMNEYQALDGDRGGVKHLTRMEEGPTYTSRPVNTDGVSNRARKDRDGEALGSDTGKPYWYSHSPETDESLYSRKVAEAKLPPGDYADAHRGGGLGSSRPGSEFGSSVWEHPDNPQHATGHTSTFEHDEEEFYAARADSKWGKQAAYDSRGSLYNSIKEEGVRSPIHLGKNIGTMGKPQVAGGHHRLGAQFDIDPDQPMPVLHHEDIQAARRSSASGGYKYS